jgi:hypothetical protein
MEGKQDVNQLLDEYFKRDLTEAEEEQLAQGLSSSEEDAQRFIGLMESHYRSLGLPEPEWAEGPLPAFFPKSRFRSIWKGLGVLLLLTIVGLGYFLYRSLSQTGELSSQAPLTPAIETPVPEKANHAKPKTAPTTKTSKGRIYEELSVVVDNPQPGLVTVKVKDSSGSEVNTLYAGILPSGQKTFTWDGKAGNGLVAHPGTYYLEVTSGAHILRKKIHLGSNQ